MSAIVCRYMLHPSLAVISICIVVAGYRRVVVFSYLNKPCWLVGILGVIAAGKHKKHQTDRWKYFYHNIYIGTRNYMNIRITAAKCNKCRLFGITAAKKTRPDKCIFKKNNICGQAFITPIAKRTNFR